MSTRFFTVLCGLILIGTPAYAQHQHPAPELQKRGALVMGVDQYTSTHVFDDLADGGRIELQRDVDDTAGVKVIRAHLQTIAKAFKAGDFSASATVHDQTVPGTKTMTAKRTAITYTYSDLARGGQIRIQSKDAAAVRAIHEFLAFQRGDHRASGKTQK
jgi:uncharacterized protein YjhX (UPF0386 family)